MMNKLNRWFYGVWVDWGFAKDPAKIMEAAKAYPSTAVNVFTKKQYLRAKVDTDNRLSLNHVAEILEFYDGLAKNNQAEEVVTAAYSKKIAVEQSLKNKFVAGFTRLCAKDKTVLAGLLSRIETQDHLHQNEDVPINYIEKFNRIEIFTQAVFQFIGVEKILSFIKKLIQKNRQRDASALVQSLDEIRVQDLVDAYDKTITFESIESERALRTSLSLPNDAKSDDAISAVEPKATKEEAIALHEILHDACEDDIVAKYKARPQDYLGFLARNGLEQDKVVARFKDIPGADLFQVYPLSPNTSIADASALMDKVDVSIWPKEEAFLTFVKANQESGKASILSKYFDARGLATLGEQVFVAHAQDATIFDYVHAKKSATHMDWFGLDKLGNFQGNAHAERKIIEEQLLSDILRVYKSSGAFKTIYGVIKGANHRIATHTAEYLHEEIATAQANATDVMQLLREHVSPSLDFVSAARSDVKDFVYSHYKDTDPKTKDYIEWAMAAHTKQEDEALARRIYDYAMQNDTIDVARFVFDNGLVEDEKFDALIIKYPSLLSNLSEVLQQQAMSDDFNAIAAAMKAAHHPLFVDTARYMEANLAVVKAHTSASMRLLRDHVGLYFVDGAATEVKDALYPQYTDAEASTKAYVAWAMAQYAAAADKAAVLELGDRIIAYAIAKQDLAAGQFAKENSLYRAGNKSQDLAALQAACPSLFAITPPSSKGSSKDSSPRTASPSSLSEGNDSTDESDDEAASTKKAPRRVKQKRRKVKKSPSPIAVADLSVGDGDDALKSDDEIEIAASQATSAVIVTSSTNASPAKKAEKPVPADFESAGAAIRVGFMGQRRNKRTLKKAMQGEESKLSRIRKMLTEDARAVEVLANDKMKEYFYSNEKHPVRKLTV